jgi:hypothetical protein
MPKIFCDIIRWILIIGATIFAVKWLWDVHWALGLILVFPLLIIFLNVFGFPTLLLYGYTKEALIARNMLNKLSEPNKPKDEENSKYIGSVAIVKMVG